ncbi:MAG: hypothetical protein ACRC9Q_06930 [Bacteroidales bacterium]
MKNPINRLFLMAISSLTLFSCEPIEERADIGSPITAEELQISAEPIVVNGKNSNRVVLKCSSPVLSYWDYGVGDSNRSNDTISLLFTGTNEIVFTGLNPDGSKLTKTLSVNVDVLANPVPQEWEMLFGSGEKEWTWSTTFTHLWGAQVCLGNGGYLTDQLICWWNMGVNSEDLVAAAEADGKGAKMKFCKNGVKFIKTQNNGNVIEGKFSLDMNKKTLDPDGKVWSIGRLYIKGNPQATILRGWNDSKVPMKEFDIIKMSDNTMQLSEVPASGAGQWSAVIGWAFDSVR